MSLRLLQVVAPVSSREELARVLENHPAQVVAIIRAEDDRICATARVRAEDAEELMDELNERFGKSDPFQVALVPIEAALPLPEEEQESEPPARGRSLRISREELLEDLAGATRVSPIFCVLVAVASLVAAVGLVRDDVAVVIAAMVIAPLLGPNIALSLATTLGDSDLLVRAGRTNIVGMGIALLIAVLWSLVAKIDPGASQIAARLDPTPGDIVIAVSAGVAGTLAFTTGTGQALVGVMVAVALLPPTVTLGFMLGKADLARAAGAATLLATNIIALNLASTAVFLSLGVRPRTWWEAQRARVSARRALIIWTVLLALLMVLLLYRR